jgi:hypothetical protein
VIVFSGPKQRFLPSEFGNDVDHAKALEPVNTMYGKKVAIRRKIEAAGIPYTYISSNAFAGYSLSNIVQFGKPAPPRDKVTIYGSGDAKGKSCRSCNPNHFGALKHTPRPFTVTLKHLGTLKTHNTHLGHCSKT